MSAPTINLTYAGYQAIFKNIGDIIEANTVDNGGLVNCSVNFTIEILFGLQHDFRCILKNGSYNVCIMRFYEDMVASYAGGSWIPVCYINKFVRYSVSLYGFDIINRVFKIKINSEYMGEYDLSNSYEYIDYCFDKLSFGKYDGDGLIAIDDVFVYSSCGYKRNDILSKCNVFHL